MDAQRLAQLERQRADFKVALADAWRAGDYETEAMVLRQIQRLDEAIHEETTGATNGT